MEITYKITSRSLWLVISGMIMVFCSYFIYAYDPVNLIIKMVFVLKPNSLFYNLWKEPPYEVLIIVNIFNVTNHEQFLSGEDAKLNFTEVGPYTFREILTNENATFHDDGTVTFYPRRRIILDPSRSIGDPKLDRIISPNIPLIGIQSYLNDEFFLTSLGFSSLSRVTGAKSFINLTVDEYLWGYDDPIVKLANQYIPSWIDFERFGIFDRLIAVDNGNVVTISTQPEKNHHSQQFLSEQENKNLYHIVDWNGSPGLKEWGWVDSNGNETNHKNKKCQMVAGTFEGTILPNYLSENTSVKMFRKAFCRPVPLDLIAKDFDSNGFQAYTYRISDQFLESPDVNPENQCFCVNGRCLPKGLSSLSPCYYGIPITMSRPHFLNADPSVLEPFNGLEADPEMHDSFAKVHPTLGVPLEGHLRVQINLDVGKTQYNSLTKPFNDMHLPLFWLELTTGDFPSIVYNTINWSCHIGPVIQTVFMYLLGILGLSLISTSALLLLFYNTQHRINHRLSLKTEYASLPTIITIPSQYFKTDLKISK